MATIFTPLNTITNPLMYDPMISSSLDSLERQELVKLTDKIFADLRTTQKWSALLEIPEEIEYNAIPPKQTFEVTAKYEFPGKGKPLNIGEFDAELLEESDINDYNSIPPKRSFKVTVNYQFQSQGKPLPYSTDI